MTNCNFDLSDRNVLLPPTNSFGASGDNEALDQLLDEINLINNEEPTRSHNWNRERRLNSKMNNFLLPMNNSPPKARGLIPIQLKDNSKKFSNSSVSSSNNNRASSQLPKSALDTEGQNYWSDVFLMNNKLEEIACAKSKTEESDKNTKHRTNQSLNNSGLDLGRMSWSDPRYSTDIPYPQRHAVLYSATASKANGEPETIDSAELFFVTNSNQPTTSQLAETIFLDSQRKPCFRKLYSRNSSDTKEVI